MNRPCEGILERMRIKTAWIVGLALLAAADARAEPPICTCRYAGQSYRLGTCVCIVTPNGARRACCGKVLNNTSWSFKGDTCPERSPWAQMKTTLVSPSQTAN